MTDAPLRDDSSITGRVKRYAKVGTAVGGLAARYAGGRFLGLDLDTGAHAGELKAALGGLKGPLMKVAQILSTIPDVLPEEYTRELRQLQTNAPAMGWAFVKRRMRSELGPDWQSRFAHFEHTATAAASLGQVHRATAHDGRALACKLQYPDMGSAVEADLKQLALVFSLYRRYDKAIDPSEILKELSARLREELDYEREARHMALYRHMLKDEAGIAVPDLLDDLSTDRLLTMNWLDGNPLLSVCDGPLDVRNAVATNMFRAWYIPFYTYGVIHGDPHLGNYSVRPDNGINLLDFGCIRVFPSTFVAAVIDLYRAMRDDDEALARHAYETWGFVDLSREMMDVLNHWARFIYGPLMKDKVQTIQDSGGTVYGGQVAAKVHRELKRIGGVTPPREFVLMDRAAIGLGGVFMHLKAEINWYQAFHGLIEDFDPAQTARRQAQVLAQFDIPEPD
ncbi:MAG: AarF/ABC1/UbiB kinase family protein [Rhodobacterales bacterium]|nr:AarF/ABC1/UbiB kinase family protein [Rhodobacterales bacterium]